MGRELWQVWDLRMLKELGSYRGHVRDVMCAAWHPVHEELFSSGSQDGTLMYWLLSRSAPQVRGQRWPIRHPGAAPVCSHEVPCPAGASRQRWWARTKGVSMPWRGILLATSWQLAAMTL